MTGRDFVYWLQGFFELNDLDPNNGDTLGPKQVECIKKHLNMVFIHEIDPAMGDQAHQDRLTEAHDNDVNDVNINEFVEALRREREIPRHTPPLPTWPRQQVIPHRDEIMKC